MHKHYKESKNEMTPSCRFYYKCGFTKKKTLKQGSHSDKELKYP